MAKDMWVGANAKPALTNLLDGGKFKNTTYWGTSNATYTVSGFVATVTSTGNWASLYRDVDTTNGHIYYARIRVKYATTTSHYGAMLAFKTRSNLGGSSTASVRATKFDGTWQSISVRTTLNYADARVLLYNPYTGSGTAMKNFTVQWNQPLLIDLTACFGAGNEPTQAWCDSNISFFDSITSVEYTNIPNVSRKVETPYFGVGNVVRKVKNGYLGVGGVARQFYSSGSTIGDLAIGSVVSIGGDTFTVVEKNISKSPWSGNGTILLSDTPASTAAQTWDNSRASIALNSTVASLAKATSTGNHNWTSGGSEYIRYVNGEAVTYWLDGAYENSMYIDSKYDSSGNYIGGDYYEYNCYVYTMSHTGKVSTASTGYYEDGADTSMLRSKCWKFRFCEVDNDLLFTEGSDGIWYYAG